MFSVVDRRTKSVVYVGRGQGRQEVDHIIYTFISQNNASSLILNSLNSSIYGSGPISTDGRTCRATDRAAMCPYWRGIAGAFLEDLGERCRGRPCPRRTRFTVSQVSDAFRTDFHSPSWSTGSPKVSRPSNNGRMSVNLYRPLENQ